MARGWQTPTATLTALGLAFAVLYAAGQPWAAWPAVACLALPGIGGTAIAIYEHVEDAMEEWTWRGIWRAFMGRRPGRPFWWGLLTHLPQALLAAALVAAHRRGRGPAGHGQG